MNDDEPIPVQTVRPDYAVVAEHAKKLREASDAADMARALREPEEVARTVADIRQAAKRQVDAFAKLPCLGSLEHVGACSETFALTCERRISPSCPREIRAYDEAEERKQALAVFAAAGMPLRAADAVLNHFRPTEATMAVDRFLSDEEATTLVLAGSVGVGKTVAAAYAMRRRRGFCHFVGAGTLTSTSQFDAAAVREKRLAYDCGLLVVDDLGTEYGDAKGWFQSVLDPLIVDRHERKRRTVITCNLDAAAFAARYGERIADRIAGCGMFVQLAGESLRGHR